MKVLLFTDNLGAGGAQRQLVGLSVLLKNRGYTVKICCYQHVDFFGQFLKDNGVEQCVVPNSQNTKLRIPVMARFFSKEKPDYVIAYQETPSIVACVCKMLGCKYKLIVSERTTTQVIHTRDKIRFRLYRFADYIVPNSFTQGEFIAQNYSTLKQCTHVIPNFVDLTKFQPKYHLRGEVPKIMVAASIVEHKNTLNLIKAAAILKNEGYSFMINWYGVLNSFTTSQKKYLERCEQIIHDLNVDDCVNLFPKTTRISEIYREADYFCLPSFYEGTPNVICEAMASGCPIICSDVCDNSRYVIESKNGFLFNPHNPENIASKILKALNLSNDNYQSYCYNSRKIAETMFSEEKFVDKYIGLLT